MRTILCYAAVNICRGGAVLPAKGRKPMTLDKAIFIGAIFIGAGLTASASGATVPPDRDNLVVHEWGTFTSVAGASGEPVYWAPLIDTPDLPCFVEHLSPQNPKASNALVRMETPVLYFYPQH